MKISWNDLLFDFSFIKPKRCFTLFIPLIALCKAMWRVLSCCAACCRKQTFYGLAALEDVIQSMLLVCQSALSNSRVNIFNLSFGDTLF